jgi:hypothetical protein
VVGHHDELVEVKGFVFAETTKKIDEDLCVFGFCKVWFEAETGCCDEDATLVEVGVFEFCHGSRPLILVGVGDDPDYKVNFNLIGLVPESDLI